MTSNNILTELDQIHENQSEESYALVAYHLEGERIEEVKTLLESDTPIVGAVGRYRGIPVFAEKTLPPNLSHLKAETTIGKNGIGFSYLRLVIMN
jgi:hypothetical protein